MSMGSWWTWGRHGLDTSGYDTAVNKVDKYTKLLDNLNSKISDYDVERENVEINYDELNKVIGCYNDGTSGYWVRFYEEKVELWKTNRNTFYGKMDDEFEYAKQRRDRVSELKEKWIEQRDSEERSLNDQLDALQRKGK
ncbi:MAG: hypothetical protein IJJ59_14520 [Pseudobutyrivibrio sp.]|uniref:hypothetical protein n=1 Tax=Pseudobutyrivibrio sp. TaxID=2014367 RepID=UPI00260051D0|nr:hypothetical protein [Pseudobutyrivibrio sp.]MBQ6464538.1 hypothetical protein [Pseudobutyrivibrio sp.]